MKRHKCKKMPVSYTLRLVWSPKGSKFGVFIKRAISPILVVDFCPFCGWDLRQRRDQKEE
jgi:hypothetical protein